MQFNRNPPVPIYESTTDVSLGWLSCHHSANALSVRFEVESSASDGRSLLHLQHTPQQRYVGLILFLILLVLTKRALSFHMNTQLGARLHVEL